MVTTITGITIANYRTSAKIIPINPNKFYSVLAVNTIPTAAEPQVSNAVPMYGMGPVDLTSDHNYFLDWTHKLVWSSTTEPHTLDWIWLRPYSPTQLGCISIGLRPTEIDTTFSLCVIEFDTGSGSTSADLYSHLNPSVKALR